MRVTLYCDSCVNILSLKMGLEEALGSATVELDLTDIAELSPESVHAAMQPSFLDAMRTAAIENIKDYTHEEATLTIVCGHEDDWTAEVARDLADMPTAELFEFAEFTQDRDVNDLEAFLCWVADYVNLASESTHEIRNRWQDAYRGTYYDAADYAQELASECFEMPDTSTWPYSCIDWDEAATQLEQSGDISVLELDNGHVVIIDPSV